MTLSLPPLVSLTPEQREVVALPFDGSCLVTGGPGAGKTMTAIYRAAALHRAGLPTLMLMYSKVLSAYSRTAVADLGTADTVTTYHKWLHDYWRRHYGRNPPTVERYGIDWMACFSQVMTEPPTTAEPPYIVVDEGQDMPKEFYLLLRAVTTNVTVFADEHQRINNQQSTAREIRAASGIRTSIKLPGNARNTRPIADLAAHFRPDHDGDTSSLADGPRPLLVRDEDRASAVDRIIRYEQDHQTETIGVILHRIRDLYSYYHQLDGRTVSPVQGYASGTRSGALAEPAFTGPGIKLISWKSAKGLQFDSVYVPELQSATADPTMDDTRMQLYVLITRARRRLTFMYTGTGLPAIAESLPASLICSDGNSSRPDMIG